VQQNQIKALHHNGNPLEQKRRCSNIPGRLHQSPAAQLAQELKSIAVDWDVGFHRIIIIIIIIIIIYILILILRSRWLRS